MGLGSSWEQIREKRVQKRRNVYGNSPGIISNLLAGTASEMSELQNGAKFQSANIPYTCKDNSEQRLVGLSNIMGLLLQRKTVLPISSLLRCFP